MPDVIITGATKIFGKTVAVDNLSLKVTNGTILSLLGPSGCGKTTMLRCIAGFETLDKGEISVGEELVVSVEKGINIPPSKRGMGMVFQSYALWPDKRVFDNVAYPLKLRKISKPEIRRRVLEMLQLVELSGLEDRYPAELSGGQQQRVALARSLVYEPDVLLLDEPLSNLDAKLRQQARFWLRGLQRKIGITTLYVTHDQAEAFVISDEIAVMNNGAIEQLGNAREIYEKPSTPFIASFIGQANLIPAVAREVPASPGELGLAELESDEGIFLRCYFGKSFSKGQKITLSVRPERIGIHLRKDEEKLNIIMARLIRKVYHGDYVEYRLQMGKNEIEVHTLQELDAKEIYVHIPPQHITVT